MKSWIFTFFCVAMACRVQGALAASSEKATTGSGSTSKVEPPKAVQHTYKCTITPKDKKQAAFIATCTATSLADASAIFMDTYPSSKYSKGPTELVK